MMVWSSNELNLLVHHWIIGSSKSNLIYLPLSLTKNWSKLLALTDHFFTHHMNII